MGKLISLSIDLSKIDKNKIKTTDKNGQPFKNGAKYYDVTLSLHDDKDQFGNDCSLWTSQTKEERDAKATRSFIGNGKVTWSSDTPASSPPPVNAVPIVDDLPF